MFNMVRGGNSFISCTLRGEKIKIVAKELNRAESDSLKQKFFSVLTKLEIQPLRNVCILNKYLVIKTTN